MLNRCILMGRLTKDPEIRYTQETEPKAVARFGLAIDRNFSKNGQKVTDFFEIEAWRQKAEFAEKHFRKGQIICVEGSFQRYEWEDKTNGGKRYGYKVAVENFYFAESKKQEDPYSTSYGDPSLYPYEEQNIGINEESIGFDPFATVSSSSFDPFSTNDMSFNIQ